MKQSLILLQLVFAVGLPSFSQGHEKLLNSTCDCLGNLLKTKMEKVEFQFAHDDCFKQCYSVAINLKSADSTEAFVANFLEELKSNCDPYNKCHEILGKMTLEKSKIRVKDKRTCKQFMQVGEFEDKIGTEKTIMSMRDSIQIMTFGPGLYTKSKVIWRDDCTYSVIFIESTNPYENSILKKGDERVIRIVDIKDNGEVIFEAGMYGRWFLGRVNKL